MLRSARDHGTAVLAVTSYTLESTTAIIRAAETVGTPIAYDAEIEVGLHLDHCSDIDEIAGNQPRLHLGHVRWVPPRDR